MLDLAAQFNKILPLACKWAETHEALILQDGEPLSSQLLSDAKAVGVAHPAKVRILAVPSIPSPEDSLLKAACMQTKFLLADTGGLTLRYGIYIRSDCLNDHRLCVHELVHVAQYERFGGIRQFLERYLQELLVTGYSSAMPMEKETDNIARRIC